MKPPGSLSPDEQMVLELKKSHLCQDMDWEPPLTEQLMDDEILDEETNAKIVKVKKPASKTALLVTALQQHGEKGHVERLADALEGTDIEKNRWLADALVWAMAHQKGRLKMDDHIDFEAGYVVHREHGHEKRLSEGEKRIVKRLIMCCCQVQKNIMQKYIQRIRGDGDVQRNDADHKESAMVRSGRDLDGYLAANTHRVGTQSKHAAGNSALFVELVGYEYVKRETDGAIVLMTSSILAHDKLAMERDRTKDMVGLSHAADVKLYEELEGAIARHAQEFVKAQSQMVQVEKDIARMESELEEMQREFEQSLLRKNKILRLLQKEVDHYQEQYDKLEEQAVELRPISKSAMDEIYDWKQRKDELSKSKRITDMKKKKGKVARVMEKMTGDDLEDDDEELDINKILDSVRAENSLGSPSSLSLSSRQGSGGSGGSGPGMTRSGSGGLGKSVAGRSSAARKETLTKSRSDPALVKLNVASPAGSRKSVKKVTTARKP